MTGAHAPRLAATFSRKTPGVARSSVRIPRRALRGAAARRGIALLANVLETLSKAGLDRLAVDLGDLRDFEYYTGVTFQALARGPGDAVASGGRYDGLCGRYGRDLPAVGFAIDVENLETALGGRS